MLQFPQSQSVYEVDTNSNNRKFTQLQLCLQDTGPKFLKPVPGFRRRTWLSCPSILAPPWKACPWSPLRVRPHQLLLWVFSVPLHRAKPSGQVPWFTSRNGHLGHSKQQCQLGVQELWWVPHPLRPVTYNRHNSFLSNYDALEMVLKDI